MKVTPPVGGCEYHKYQDSSVSFMRLSATPGEERKCCGGSWFSWSHDALFATKI